MFSQRLKELRKQHHLTQKQLADILYVDQTAISYWENGKTNPDFEKQQKLAEIFHVSINYLFGENEETSALKTARSRVQELHESNPQITVDMIEKALGVNYQTFRAWYSGLSDYFNNKLETIADLYNVSVDYLLGRDTKPTLDEQLDGVDFALYGEIHDLTDDEKKDILSYIKFKKSQRGE